MGGPGRGVGTRCGCGGTPARVAHTHRARGALPARWLLRAGGPDVRFSCPTPAPPRTRPGTEWFVTTRSGTGSHLPELLACDLSLRLQPGQVPTGLGALRQGGTQAPPVSPGLAFIFLPHRQLKTVMEKHFITHVQLASNEMINFSCIMASNVCLLFFPFKTGTKK